MASALRGRGHDVRWASDGRGPATAECDLILSVCPPHAAAAVAEQVVGYTGVYVDANAVSPATARAIGDLVTGGGFHRAPQRCSAGHRGSRPVPAPGETLELMLAALSDPRR